MEKSLGKLEKMDLRHIWNHEAIDFTHWLAREENLTLLSDEVGIDIKLIKTEANVGNFNVDILAEEENTGRKVIIENQLETTDHDHLGKIITYASGHDAEIVIWIVKEVRDEHKQAVDWLNEHTDEKINFFIIKMELWKIGDSLPAPKFYIRSQPNDWAKAIKKSTSSEPSATQLLQLEFWNKFIEYAGQHNTVLRLRSARPQHWYEVAVGSAKARISFTVNTQERIIGCEIYIPQNKELFKSLELKKEEIEKELGTTIEWMELESKKASRIKLSYNSDMNDTDNWESCFEWMHKWGEKFHNVFSNHIKSIEKSVNLSS